MALFQHKRFIDNPKFAKQAGAFVERKHYTAPAFLFISYFLAFLISGLMAFYFEGNPVLISAAFLIFFGAAAMINAIYLRRFHEINNSIEFQNSIYAAALKGDSEFCLIFNEDGDVVYADPRFHEKFSDQKFRNLGEVERVMEVFKLTPDERQMIQDVIFQNKFISEIDANIDEEKQKKSILLKPFHLKGGDFSIAVNSLERPLGFTCLKVHKINEEKEFGQLVDELGIGFYELDGYGHITGVNEYFAKMLGYTKDELSKYDISIESLINMDKSMDSLISNPSMTDALLGNWQGFLTFGTKFKEQVHTLVIQKSFFGASGKVERIIGYAVKLHDQSLMLKSQGVEKGWIDYSWQCFFNDSPYPVTILDKSGSILRINHAFEELLPGDFIGKKIMEVFQDEDRGQIKEMIDAVLSRQAQPTPIRNVKIEGSEKVLDVYMGKILDLNGDIYGFMVRIADLTQQKELEDSLSHAQRMQTVGHLAGSVAHDFNNLLTAISGFCDLLFLRHTVGDPSFSHIMQIKQSADRAANLVKRLLAFSRKQTLKPQILNLNELFGDLSSLIQRLIGAEVNLALEISSDIWTVKVDPVQMEQVVLNLVVNAHHAMDTDGKLTVRVNNIKLKDKDPYIKKFESPSGEGMPPAGEYVAIEVEDTGEGIDPSIIKNIFEPFFTTKEQQSGTGLGLSTVYGIIRQSGGYIYVKSKVGKGSTFLIYLKRYEATKEELAEIAREEKEQIKESKEVKKDTSGKGTIALVEDEEAVRLFAKNVLINKGYDVIEFESAKKALNVLSAGDHKIDLIVTDVMMPEMTGPTFITEIKKVYPDIKVIFISGYGEEAFTEEYGDARDFNFIPKPFSLKQLVSKVKEVLED